jgi:dimethylaniline monooxygenase (N-oxide forming)
VSTTPEAQEPGAPPPDEVSIHIAATPEQIWDLVSDVTRMGEWSPECFRCRWYGAAKEPVVGAKFVGFNRAGWRIWATRNVVEQAEPGRVFAWRTRSNGNIWSYRIEPVADDEGGTLVTESRQLPARRPLYAKLLLIVFFRGLEHHDQRMRAGMRQTVARLKTVAEAA